MTEILFFEDEHKYIVDGVEVPSITEIIEPVTSRGYREINKTMLDQAARRGRAVHEALELLDMGCEDAVPSEIAGYIKAYQAFLADYRPTWEQIEKVVYYEDAERGERYAGTVDRAGRFAGSKQYVVLDIKTNGSPTKDNKIAVCCQTAAYAQALGEEWAKRYALYLSKDGKYRLMDCVEWENDYSFNGFALFDALLNLATRLGRIKENGKRNGIVRGA